MKNKTIISIFSLIVFAAICFTTCDMGNPIMEKWWVEPEPKEEEPEYIPLTKNIPIVSYETIYKTIIDKEIQYETIFVSLPPEIVYETVYVDKPVYEIVYEQLPPEIIYVQLPPEVIYETVEKIVTETEYVTVYQEIEKIVEIEKPLDKDEIIKWLTNPDNEDDVKKIIEIIKDMIPKEVIEEIIKEIPPKDIMEYLTDEQIKYIVKQQPPSMILQSIRIIGIEYVIFAGSSDKVNGPPAEGANTSLTAQEISYNTSTIKEMAQLLKDNPTYILMLHGHANPVTFTDAEKAELTALSNDRATDVKRVLMAEYNGLKGENPINYTNPTDNPDLNGRVSTSGYGGEKTLFANNNNYTPLNRRVEMILFEIVTTVVAPNSGN
jgi:hypothetical protein